MKIAVCKRTDLELFTYEDGYCKSWTYYPEFNSDGEIVMVKKGYVLVSKDYVDKLHGRQ